MEERINRHILCIDLKSFFASVECVERGLNPFTTPLVVASNTQGNGAITLAITPFLKGKGIPSRTRLYEIPKDITYQIVPPRMSLYIQKSSEVVNIYLDFVSENDLHIYSIDECFLDVTTYLKYYGLTDEELALKILQTIEKKTGLTATCGIGPNMLLAKIAMDKEAKKYKNGIAKWTYDDIPKKLWPITPLSEVWGIGKRLEKRLNNLGIYSIYELAHYDQNALKEKFGILGLELYEHANGIDNSLICEFKHQPKEKSISHSQVLLKDYYDDDILLIIKEMLEVLTRRLRTNHLECRVIHLSISYSKNIGGGFAHSLKLECAIDKTDNLYQICKSIFDRYYLEHTPIRKVGISLGKLSKKEGIQLDLFENFEKKVLNEKLDYTLDNIHNKYGKNSILKATSLLSYSTIKERNQKIGGHHE